jgi:hypothetical protein
MGEILMAEPMERCAGPQRSTFRCNFYFLVPVVAIRFDGFELNRITISLIGGGRKDLRAGAVWSQQIRCKMTYFRAAIISYCGYSSNTRDRIQQGGRLCSAK